MQTYSHILSRCVQHVVCFIRQRVLTFIPSVIVAIAIDRIAAFDSRIATFVMKFTRNALEFDEILLDTLKWYNSIVPTL